LFSLEADFAVSGSCSSLNMSLMPESPWQTRRYSKKAVPMIEGQMLIQSDI
jgi:hypothetical protein